MTTTNQKEINRSISKKKSDQFAVYFYRIDNPKNILGRQVKTFERPTITFGQSDQFHRGIRVPNGTSQLSYGEFTITFYDDQWSLCSKAIYDHISNQISSRSTFDIKLDIYGINNEIVETHLYKDCTIISVSHSEHSYAQSINNEISITCNVTDIEITR